MGLSIQVDLILKRAVSDSQRYTLNLVSIVEDIVVFPDFKVFHYFRNFLQCFCSKKSASHFYRESTFENNKKNIRHLTKGKGYRCELVMPIHKWFI